MARADWDKYKQLLAVDIDIPDNATPQTIDELTSEWTNRVKLASDAIIPQVTFGPYRTIEALIVAEYCR